MTQTQKSLFDLSGEPSPPVATRWLNQEPKAVARADGPRTSKVAADKMNRTGAVKSHCELILEALASGPATCGEIAGRIRSASREAILAHHVGKRMRDLARAGKINELGERVCSIEESEMTVWGLK